MKIEFQRQRLVQVRTTLATLSILLSLGISVAACNTCDDIGCGAPLRVFVSDELVPVDGTIEIAIEGVELNCLEDSRCNWNPRRGESSASFAVFERPTAILLTVLDENGAVVDSFDVKPEYNIDTQPGCDRPACNDHARVFLP